ncbi:ribonuclease HII [Mollicutes bacterium LVI A0078]|nr:ribonuclease HII [Mollicutes bacterium LVI A0075]WOO90903.1 ribonuclease HII [Mollicutes bacterium LVI A0078]
MNNLRQLYKEKNKYEADLLASGFKFIAGVDEVGRGPLAGPVTVAAVILDPKKPIYGLKDSKKLSSKKIEELSNQIKQDALAYAIVSATPSTIDKIGISVAIHKCMRTAIRKLSITPDYVLIDHEYLKFNKIESKAITKGDDNSNSIAAASIIAKYARDTKMEKLGIKYPEYGFENHVGYGTKHHRETIEKLGPIPNVHRYSFKPIRKD